MSLKNFTKILSYPVVLNIPIEDDNVIFMLNYNGMNILDRNDVIGNPHCIDYAKCKSNTVVKEFNLAYTYDIFAYNYLDNIIDDHLNLNRYINETLFVVKKKISYTRYKMVIVFLKINQEYSIDCYYNTTLLNNFLDNKLKDCYTLRHLLEFNEYNKIRHDIDIKLTKVLDCLKWDNDSEIESPFVVNLFDYQYNDVSWIKYIEDNVDRNLNNLEYTLKPYYNILNNYIMDVYNTVHINVDTHYSIKTGKYYGGNLISEMGVGKTLVVLCAILTDPIINIEKTFIKYTDHCNYFYKLGEKKGKCCTKPKKTEMYCSLHSKSVFIDKKNIEFVNGPVFKITDFLNENFYFTDNRGIFFNKYNTNCTLVLCPNHLCDQWAKEYYTKTNENLKKKLHIVVVTTFSQYTNLSLADILFADIIITSYEFLVNKNYKHFSTLISVDQNDTNILKSKSFLLTHFYWHRIIFDEYHEIKSKNNHIFEYCKILQSKYRWNVSGTPFANNVDGFIEAMQLTTNLSLNMSACYNNHIKLTNILSNGLNNDLIENSKFLFKKNMKRNYNIVEVNKLLTFTDQERLIYDSHLSGSRDKYSKFLIQLCCHPDLFAETKVLMKKCKTLQEIQQTLIELNQTKLKNFSKNLLTSQRELLQLQQLEQNEVIQQQISILKRNITNTKKQYDTIERTITYINSVLSKQSENENCPICLDIIQTKTITKCGHQFCWKCFEEYSRITKIPKCPNCKESLNSEDLYVVSEQELQIQNQLEQYIQYTKSTKIGNIIHYLKQLKNTDKIIIFSQWDYLLDKLGEYLVHFEIFPLYCKGSVYQKKRAIESFQTSKNDNIILLSSRHAASGINLTNANHVIFIEPVYGTTEYRDNIENQAIGRCARIGHIGQITVNRFIINNTIESDIHFGNIEQHKLNNTIFN